MLEQLVKAAAQARYCREVGTSRLAPRDGICPECRRSIYAAKGGYTLDESASGLIYECPHCKHDFL